MSAKGSAKKNFAFSEANEALYDVYQSNPLPERYPSDPRWPEWSDADVNAETWGNKVKPQTTSKGTGKSESALDQASPYYVDPEPWDLPPEVVKHVASWKRPHEMFPPESLALYESLNPDVALRSSSEMVSRCELYRIISDVVSLLQYHSGMELFPTECETANYSSNTKAQPWQPWHHIYGNCRAGKDAPHRPVYYPYGKYIIRLYYFGGWRKFVVDDQIPCDAGGRCLLPMTRTVGELWPIILVKAILKISSVTTTSHAKQIELPVWTLFTGWVLCPAFMTQKTVEQSWRLLCSLCPRFLPPEDAEPEQKPVVPSISSKGTAKKTTEKRESRRQSQQDEGRPVVVVAELRDLPPECKTVDDSCLVVVLMTRDAPLTKSRMRKPTEPWKRIRWVHWAAKKGIWTDELLIPPYRCLHLINFVREVNDLICVDPKTENCLFVPEVAEAEAEDPDASSDRAETPYSPVQWIDFFKFSNYLASLVFLFKPSTLVSKWKITYITSGLPPSAPGAAKSKNPPAAVAEPSSYYLVPAINISRNEPPILFCESTAGIFICFSLWVCPHIPMPSYSYLANDHPCFLKAYHGSLIVEWYDWRTSRQNEIVGAIKTLGNGTCCVFLNPGRHALKIWLSTDSPFVIEVYSNTEVTCGRGPKIRFMMSTESLSITDYINAVSSAFLELTQRYGKPDHWRAVSAFYNAIRPRNTTHLEYEKKMDDFMDTFSKCILSVVRSLVTSDDDLRWATKALQSLFVNPNINCPMLRVRGGASVVLQTSQKRGKKENSYVAETRERSSSEFVDCFWEPQHEEKAATVQRFFRGYRVRQLIRYQSPSSREHKTVTDKLKRICDSMFAPGKREVEVARLIREVIAAKPNLLETFSFHKDISNVMVTEEFTGKIIGVEPNAWVPMIRFTFACHSQDPLPCAFYHSCNLEQFTVTVTDNDTNEEIFRLVNTTCPHYYARNEKGYTLFVYGWNESETKTVNWRLEMVKMKYFLEIHPCNVTLLSATGGSCHPYQPQPLTVHELRNFYVPNKYGQICKCLIKVRKRVLLTIRLSTSFEDARFYAKIYQRPKAVDSESTSSFEDFDAVIEAEAKSSAIIFPSVLLDHQQSASSVTVESRDEQSDQTVYVLEAYVVNNSWPLTKHEWGIVEPIRVNGESWQESPSSMNIHHSRKSSTGSRRRSVRTSKSATGSHKSVENPFWYLQVVSDFVPDVSHFVEVIEDRSYQEMVKAMKMSWEENDPGRRQRGKLIQREFLRSVYYERVESKIFSYTEVDSKSSGTLDALKSADKVESVAFTTGPSSDEGFEALLQEMRSFSYLVQDKSTTRYDKSPRILPWVPMESLMAKYSRGKEEIDVALSMDSSRNPLGEDYVVWNLPKSSRALLQDERKHLLTTMKAKRRIMNDYMSQESNLSCRLMQQAYQERAKVVERMKVLKPKSEAPLDAGDAKALAPQPKK